MNLIQKLKDWLSNDHNYWLAIFLTLIITGVLGAIITSRIIKIEESRQVSRTKEIHRLVSNIAADIIDEQIKLIVKTQVVYVYIETNAPVCPDHMYTDAVGWKMTQGSAAGLKDYHLQFGFREDGIMTWRLGKEIK